MMKISGASGAGSYVQPGSSGMQTDSVSRNIQSQMEAARKRLQELSSNQELSMEEKMKKRQAIQQEITNLNQQLRQHQMEQRKELQAKRDSLGNTSESNANQGGKGSGLSQAGMKAMLSADSSVKQAQVQGSAAAKLKGQANVLKAEIKQDAGTNTAAKEAELAKVEQKAEDAAASQMKTLGEVQKAAEEAAKAKPDSPSEEEAAEQKEQAGKADSDFGHETDSDGRKTSASNTAQETSLPEGYKSVDIYL